MSYLIIARGLCKKVIITRLLPGHTQEDIDALFALIWNLLKDKYCLSPNEFVSKIKQALRKIEDLEVIDLFATPDYNRWFGGFIDEEFGRFAKEEWTQLEVTFERVRRSDEYPYCVKMTTRAYTRDSVIEVIDDPAQRNL